MGERCSFGFFRKHGDTVGTCQYCGRRFCPEHGAVFEDGQEVCVREQCRDKYEDLEVHQWYRYEVRLRNAIDRCGVEGCGRLPTHQCSRCSGLFCDAHVKVRRALSRGNLRSPSPYQSLCQHCWERRKVWSKM